MAKKDDVTIEETNEQVNDEPEVKEEEVTEEEKALTQDDLNKAVSKRLKEEKAKHDKDLAELRKQMQEKIKEERKEAEELAKLSQEERAKVEKEKEEMLLKSERDNLNKERQEFERDKLKLETEKQLVERKLPAQFAKYLLGDSAEETLENINTFEGEYQEAIRTEVDQRIAGPKPKLGGDKQKRYTHDQLKGMTLEEARANMDDIDKAMESGL
jgi:hypothetical protein